MDLQVAAIDAVVVRDHHRGELHVVLAERLHRAFERRGHQVKTAECLMLEVRDSGRGFNPGTSSGRGGFGLTGMRERAEKLGGQLEVESKLGQGTCVRFTKQGPFFTS